MQNKVDKALFNENKEKHQKYLIRTPDSRVLYLRRVRTFDDGRIQVGTYEHIQKQQNLRGTAK